MKSSAFLSRRPLLSALMSISLFGVLASAVAGSLTPPGTPAPSMPSLSDINSKLTTVGTDVTTVKAGVASVDAKLAADAPQPFRAYATVVGKTQGNISNGASSVMSLGLNGDPKVEGITLTNFVVSVASPRDAVTGLPLGQRVMKPVSIEKYMDAASPLLYNAMANVEQLDITIRVERPTSTSFEEYYNYAYKGCLLLLFEQRGPNREELAFTFTSVTMTHTPAKRSVSDVWPMPVEKSAATTEPATTDAAAAPAK